MQDDLTRSALARQGDARHLPESAALVNAALVKLQAEVGGAVALAFGVPTRLLGRDRQ